MRKPLVSFVQKCYKIQRGSPCLLLNSSIPQVNSNVVIINFHDFGKFVKSAVKGNNMVITVFLHL